MRPFPLFVGFPRSRGMDTLPGPKRRQRGANERETGNTTFLMKVFTPFTPLCLIPPGVSPYKKLTFYA